MQYTLKDAVAQYQCQSDEVHRFWNYFQIVAFGVVAITWQDKVELSRAMLWALLFGFIIFSVASNYIIYAAQCQAREWSLAIKQYCSNNAAEIPQEFIGVLKAERLLRSGLVSSWHALLSLSASIAISIKLF